MVNGSLLQPLFGTSRNTSVTVEEYYVTVQLIGATSGRKQ